MERAADRLMPELQGLAIKQQNRIIGRLLHAPSRLVDEEASRLIRDRHHRRARRLQQKASRKANRS